MFIYVHCLGSRVGVVPVSRVTLTMTVGILPSFATNAFFNDGPNMRLTFCDLTYLAITGLCTQFVGMAASLDSARVKRSKMNIWNSSIEYAFMEAFCKVEFGCFWFVINIDI